MKMNLYDKLRRLEEGGAYPLHMPGHKRNTDRYRMENPYGLDITEIEGFDDLHEPEGILADCMEWAARVFGADESWYLVNGSTAGILAGIAACAQPGDRVLVARNCHKSVYNAIILRDLVPVWLYPPAAWGGRIMGSVRPEDVEAELRADEECSPEEGGSPENAGSRGKIALAVITSPTYEGVVSDVKRIADICHFYGVPLMVDEAHGAHLVLAGRTSAGSSRKCEAKGGSLDFPESALRCGADLVVQSLHKTLPAFTQTGLLHCCGDLVSRWRVKHFLDIFQSSSPSYLLMAGIDRCVRMTERCLGGEPESTSEGDPSGIDPEAWLCMLGRFYGKTASCRRLGILSGDPEIWKRDPSKLVISTAGSGHTGSELEQILRDEFSFEPEMASADYVTAMTGAGDREEEILRFADSLCEIDRRWAEEDRIQPDGKLPAGVRNLRAETVLSPAEADRIAQEAALSDADSAADYGQKPGAAVIRRMPPDESILGCISLEFVYIYPPGIPILAPGERITGEVLDVLAGYRKAGIPLRGPYSRDGIEVICQLA